MRTSVLFLVLSLAFLTFSAALVMAGDSQPVVTGTTPQSSGSTYKKFSSYPAQNRSIAISVSGTAVRSERTGNLLTPRQKLMVEMQNKLAVATTPEEKRQAIEEYRKGNQALIEQAKSEQTSLKKQTP